ncbi:dihydroorotase [Anaerovorax sp. IOR16]|uniref:dihydroorotase n=1 Tax=Anaerovorax sp. IOR16 TaxID=2773458 RepID=UPI0019D103B1|nr:dihydroorotase [Anaerovorax sp. IOR16]
MKLCIRNGMVISPANKLEQLADVYIEDGIITGITNPGERNFHGEYKEISASGKWVVPGLIDLHVHFREPGFEYKEDIESGCRAAAKGGFTTVCPMPNTKPAIDNPELVAFVAKKAMEANGVAVLPIGAITLGQEGNELSDFEAMKNAPGSIYALSEDGKSVMDSQIMMQAMKKAKDLNLPIFSHTEDRELAKGGVMNEGETARSLGLSGIPSEAEEIIAIRDILLAKNTGCQLHLCHISTKGSVELIRQAKYYGIPVTAETAPHYFLLTDKDVIKNGQETGSKRLKADPNWKMNPPLRSEEDRLEIIKGLKDGTIDVIATDHAPHHSEEKAKTFQEAPFGIIGLETSFALSFTALVKTGILSPKELISRMSKTPAEILGIDRGVIEVGKTADLAIIDVEKEYEINFDSFASKSRNTPFMGKKVFGQVCYTMVDGKVIYSLE